MQVIQIGAAAGEIWRNIDFSKWRLPTLNTVSGFVFVDVAAFRRSKSISKPNFVYMSICGWNITISVLEKQTSAILEFYFRFHFRPFHCNRRVIVHQPAEFRPKRTTHCGNTTSYQFFKMAAAAAQITSGFVSVDALSSEGQNLSANQILSMYLNSRLRYNYFRFGKRTSAIL